jgi:four helix bundle protein
MTLESWKEGVPSEIRDDPLWSMRVYQLSLFASDVSWRDAGTLWDEERTQSLADQLYQAVGSIGSNVAEGYSRGTGKDRARFYEYALGSARESRDWYFKGRFVLGEDVAQHRLSFIVLSERERAVKLPDLWSCRSLGDMNLSVRGLSRKPSETAGLPSSAPQCCTDNQGQHSQRASHAAWADGSTARRNFCVWCGCPWRTRNTLVRLC